MSDTYWSGVVWPNPRGSRRLRNRPFCSAGRGDRVAHLSRGRYEALESGVGEFYDIMDIDRVTRDFVTTNVEHVDEGDRVAFAFT